MKSLILLLPLLLMSCGRNNSGKDPLNSIQQEMAERPTDFAESVPEVYGILQGASGYGSLWSYHKTRWFTHQGKYLITSYVLSDVDFQLKVER